MDNVKSSQLNPCWIRSPGSANLNPCLGCLYKGVISPALSGARATKQKFLRGHTETQPREGSLADVS